MKRWYLIYDGGWADAARLTRREAKHLEDTKDVVCIRINRKIAFKIFLKNLFKTP